MAISLIRPICYIQNMISTRPIHVMWGKCNIWNLIFDALYLLITGNRYFQNMKCHYIYLWFSCYKRKLQHFRWTFWWSPFACDWKQLHTKYQFSSDLFLLWEVTATSDFFFFWWALFAYNGKPLLSKYKFSLYSPRLFLLWEENTTFQIWILMVLLSLW